MQLYCLIDIDAVRRIHDKFTNFRYFQSYKVTMHFLTYIIRYNETCSGKKEKKSYIYLECCMPLVDGKKEPTHSIDIRKISSKQTTHVSILQFCLLYAFYTDV